MNNNLYRAYISEQSFWLFIGLFVLIGFIGLFIPIMEVDAAQYASISREMLERNSFLQVTDNYKDYLDKPPLLFWVSALSIKLLGVSSFAYKLPSFLIALFGVFSLYKLSVLLHAKIFARLATLFYLCSVGFILMVNDVRTDTILVSFVIFATWQLIAFIQLGKTKNLLWGFVGIALAMMTKGPIGLIVPLMATMPHLALKGKWNRLLKWQWLLAPIIILAILAPMLYGLYTQFDLHPEKEAYGLQGPSGIKFFFWDQSFGRITGENAWKNDATHFYFLHNIAWSFLPFTLLLLSGFIYSLKKFNTKKEYIGLFGFILPFIALSFSHYKLPHYIYITIPFAAMLSAEVLQSDFFRNYSFKKVLFWFQHFISGILILGGLVIIFNVFKASIFIVVLCLIFLALMIYFYTKNEEKIITASIASFAFAAFVLNVHAYPSLLKYQSSSEVAFYALENNIDTNKIYQHNAWGRTLNYYTKRLTPNFDETKFEDENEAWIYLPAEDLSYFENKYSTNIETSFNHINVTRLSIGFLNPNTRENYTQKKYLIKIQHKS